MEAQQRAQEGAVRPSTIQRRRRFATRTLPLGLLAVASFVAGALTASGSSAQDAANRFVKAWAAGDYTAMHDQLNKDSKQRFPEADFTKDYLLAAQTATIARIDPGEAQKPRSVAGGSLAAVPVVVHTRAFGDLGGDLGLVYSNGGIAWDPHMVFPGLQPGERLDRRVSVPDRAAILARDGTPLAAGPADARSSPLGSAAIDVSGEVGAPEPGVAEDQLRRGFPADSPAGVSGLEKAFNGRLGGQPGGELLAAPGNRVLASAKSHPGRPVKTTIDPDLQQVTVAALGNIDGGAAVLSAKNGSVRALAGAAFSAPQPPGSTFKMVTTTAALEAHVVSLNDSFPVLTGINVGGRVIANAHDESCGGTFVEAFAHSCNSVFAPLGPKIGSERLVRTAERYGFNSPPTLYDRQGTDVVGAAPPSIPTQIPTDLDLGVSAIGQGQILATPLEMASVAQTIAAGGMRSPTPLVTDRRLRAKVKPVRVTTPAVAHTLRTLMEQVVSSGTGVAAALPGVTVAGKTGTAELGPKAQQGDIQGQTGEKPQQAVDAWFACFAPAEHPKLVVAVMVVNADGDGGTIAAPIARQILASGLGLG